MKFRLSIVALAAGFALGASAPAFSQTAEEAQKFIDTYAAPVNEWDGPKDGPAATPDKRIVILAADMTNGGILGAAEGVSEAGDAIGWDTTVIEGGGTISGRAASFGQAMALKPDGVIILGFNPVEQQSGFEQLRNADLPIVTWHSFSENGPQEDNGVFANITTNAQDVSKAAAYWAFVNSEDKKPGVVIFTDSTYEIAVSKANWMKETIEALGGEVLEYVDTPLSETSSRVPQLTTSLLQRHGAKWTHSLAINDLYFDFMSASLAAAGLPGDGQPLNIAAGDGSAAAYHRIRTQQYQAVTVAEPLNLQGWQMVDEMNRAFAGQEWSGYSSPLHIVTADNIETDGGADNRFDPENGYRDAYRAIWGVAE